MYQIGDLVVYGIHGVCKVLELEIKLINRKKVEYYVLEPLNQEQARFYVPTQNEAAVAKLRPVLTKQELERLLSSEELSQDAWIADENQRKLYYRELINRGDRVELIRMVRSLHSHKELQLAQGRKFHLCDENFLRDAEKLLSSEISLVLNISQNEVGTYMQNKLDKK